MKGYQGVSVGLGKSQGVELCVSKGQVRAPKRVYESRYKTAPEKSQDRRATGLKRPMPCGRRRGSVEESMVEKRG